MGECTEREDFVVNNKSKNFFDKIQEQTDVNTNDIFKFADSVKHANFQDEETVRQMVAQISAMANKSVSKEKEDKIVEAITQQNIPLDFQALNKMFKD